MNFYSTGEAAKKIGVSRDSLFGALKNGAPDSEIRIGGRRVFTEPEIERLADWYDAREKARHGIFRPDERGDAHDRLA